MSIERTLESLRATAPEKVTDGALLGTGVADGYAIFDSPLGDVMVTFNPSGVSSVDIADDEAEARFAARFNRRIVPARPPRGWGGKIQRAIRDGSPGGLPLDLRDVTVFQRRALFIVAQIPSGQVRPYLWVAHRMGSPRAVRAIGTTMSRNPVPLIVPCHRVVRSDGRIGNYSLGGRSRKEALLRQEGTDLARLQRLGRRGISFVGSSNTRVFCHPTCSAARRINVENVVEFDSTKTAHAAGFRPCRICRPAW